MSLSDFKGEAKPLADIDLPRIGHMIGVGEDELHAFIDVETRGSGFDSQGRPRILFERHKFYQYVPTTLRARAVKAGLASKTPGGYGKESEQYGKLQKAIAIDRTAALYSCSWGLAQVMGFNHKLAGYATVDAMVAAFMESEAKQLQGAVTFIMNCHLDDALRRHDWAAFAKGYNGTNYKKNDYDTKLADAFAKWSRIKDTPWSPDSPSSADAAAKAGPTKDVVRNVQVLLRQRGYPEVGEPDGITGPRTRNSILAFQADNGLSLTGEISDELIAQLVKAGDRPVATERAEATAKEVRKVEPTVNLAVWLRRVGASVLAASGLGGLLDGTGDLDGVTKGVGQLRDLGNAVFSLSPWLLVAVVAAGGVYFAHSVIKDRVAAYREGRSL